jgi:hypothetical protein
MTVHCPKVELDEMQCVVLNGPSMFGTGKSVRAVEREIVGLEARKTQLAKLHAQAIEDEHQAEKDLEKFLDKGDIAAGLDGAQSSVHLARQNAIDLANAVARQERLVLGAQERLAQALDCELREKVAAEREKAAEAVESAAIELQRAIELLASACQRLMGAIPRDIRIESVPEWGGRSHEQPLSVAEIARAVLAEGLYSAAPELLEAVARDGVILIHLPLLTRRAGRVSRSIQRTDADFLDTTGSARAFVADPLRQSAADIRVGAVPLDHQATLALPPASPPEPTIEMLALRPLRWRGRNGRVKRSDAWCSVDLPVSLVARARELGAAVEMGTHEAETRIEARRNQLGGLEQQPDPTDLGNG